MIFLGTGELGTGQDLASFGKQLCTEYNATRRNGQIINQKRLRPRRQSWVTETREYQSFYTALKYTRYV